MMRVLAKVRNVSKSPAFAHDISSDGITSVCTRVGVGFRNWEIAERPEDDFLDIPVGERCSLCSAAIERERDAMALPDAGEGE